MIKTAVLVSGGGTNLQALIGAKADGGLDGVELSCVVSSRPDAYALERARAAGIEAVALPRREYASDESYSEAMRRALKARGVDMVVLAGFLSILSPAFCRAFEGRILNVHPSLIPAFCGHGFYGLRVHEAVLARGVRLTGATVHLVNEIPDGGEILLQKAVGVRQGDTPETLQRRVMEEAEWEILPRAVRMLAERLERASTTGKTGGVLMGGKADLGALLRGNTYPGRGVVLGRSADGASAVLAYFIMGRSANSRNRVFIADGDGIRTQAFDPAKLTDPSLVIYAPVRVMGDRTIVSNGDQTDTIRDALAAGKTFEDALRTRTFEPDPPIYTPRISGLLCGFDYKLSIIKSQDGDGEAAQRNFFEYEGQPGTGHFLHTYQCDGTPVPPFAGEPARVGIEGDLDAFTSQVWESLNPENRVALFTRFIHVETGAARSRIVNKNQ